MFDFCRGREDLVVFGAQAVNALVDQVRMTQAVDILSPNPQQTAEELAQRLQEELHIAARIREARPGIGYRVYQTRKEGPRHLADVRLMDMPIEETVVRDGIRYTAPITTVAMKIIAYCKRRMAPKGATDLADLRRLLLAHPELKSTPHIVAESIRRLGGSDPDLLAWHELAAAPAVSDDDVDEGY